MAQESADFVVVGAGIAGAMVGERLTRRGASVILLEMEDRPGYHTTGRSAAALIESYGPPGVRELTKASVPFFEEPPDGFTDVSLLRHRGLLYAARAHEECVLQKHLDAFPSLERLNEAEALSLHGGLAFGEFEGGFAYEPSVRDIDVEAVHQSALRAFKRHGGELATHAEVLTGTRKEGCWRLDTKAGSFEAPCVVNAAGAWGDVLAGRFGVAPCGLQPKRRTVAVVRTSGGRGPVDSNWPLAAHPTTEWYFKPDGTNLWCSPSDETPVDPHDAWPDDMDVARGVQAMVDATGYEVAKLVGSWAGLRTFTPDGELRIGFDVESEGFFWLVGQGGYGIQTSPGASEKAANLLLA